MRVKIPEFGTKAELFSYLRINEKKLIAQKKSLAIKSDDLEFGYSIIESSKKTGIKTKAAMPGDPEDDNDGEIQVDIIANMSGWCDSYLDVMVKDNWNKSINDLGASGQKLVYHLKNHDYCTDAIIARDPSLYTKDIDLSIFNFTSDIKKAQGLLMSSTVCEEYDQKAYKLYRDKQVKQHSIGLRYVKIFLCIDSTEEEDAMYKDNWDKYYPGVINKDKVDSKGYFWAVTESQILEVSVVLFGANELTPVISATPDTEEEPPKSTLTQPSPKFDVDEAIRKATIIKEMVTCPNCGAEFDRNTATQNADGTTTCMSCGGMHDYGKAFDISEAIKQTTFFN